ncbi:SDR family NAD(P)-dependent oxidoreductase [Shinella sp. S4-D37]|uniref:SDR family NAD(P)-dependent oxidoreductase n=1 Tax=Shinella sp. S4-D37 TaxID=3161999 RepID=UPI003466C2C0
MSGYGFDGRTALVTGASSGIGRAVALALARQGVRVIAVARKSEGLAALARDAGNDRIVVASADLRSPQAIDALLDGLRDAMAKIDILVCSAGVSLGTELLQDADPADVQTIIDTNIKGVAHLVARLSPSLVKREAAHVVTMGAVGGEFPYPGSAAYAASKAFVRQFALSLRADFLGTPVRVTNIEPGMVRTDFATVRLRGNAAAAEETFKGVVPLEAEDIADAVLWAVSRPAHVNVNRIQIMPRDQAFGHFAFNRRV